MAEKDLPWIKWDCDTWMLETAEVQGAVLKTYLRLSTYSRNNDHEPGHLVSRIDILRMIAADTASNVWFHLVDLTSRYSVRDCQPLAEMWIEKEGAEDGWKRVLKGDEEAQKVPQGRVKLRFGWIVAVVEDMLRERANRRAGATERQRKHRAVTVTERDTNGQGVTGCVSQQVTPNHALEKRREEKNIPPIPPKGVFDGWFEEVFWKAYPRKTAKKKAREAAKKAWAAADADAIMAGLERAKESDQWRRDGGRFVPHAATWLNQERWTDEEEPGKDESGMMKDEGRGWAGKNQKSAGPALETFNPRLALEE